MLVSQPRRNRSSGFTFIELLVVSAILLLTLGGGLASYFRFNERQQVLNTTREIQTLMEVAKAKARSKSLPGGSCTTKLSDYQVAVDDTSGVKQVYLVGRCDSQGARAEVPSQSETLARPIVTYDDSISVAISDLIAFIPLTGGIKSNGNAAYAVTVTVTGSGSNVATFTVNSSGEISPISL